MLKSYRLTWIATGCALLTLSGCSPTNVLGEVPGADSGTDAQVQSGGCPATSPALTDSCPSATRITCTYTNSTDFCEAICEGGEGWVLSAGCPTGGGLVSSSSDAVPDAGAADGSSPGSPVPEGGAVDSSVPDSSVPEGGAVDSASPDSSVPEAGVPDAGACPTTSPAIDDPCPSATEIYCNYPEPLQGFCTAICGGPNSNGWAMSAGCPTPGGGLPTVNPSGCPASVPTTTDACPAASLSCFYATDGGTYVFGATSYCGATCTSDGGWTTANCP